MTSIGEQEPRTHPFNLAVVVVAPNHLAERYLATCAVHLRVEVVVHRAIVAKVGAVVACPRRRCRRDLLRGRTLGRRDVLVIVVIIVIVVAVPALLPTLRTLRAVPARGDTAALACAALAAFADVDAEGTSWCEAVVGRCDGHGRALAPSARLVVARVVLRVVGLALLLGRRARLGSRRRDLAGSLRPGVLAVRRG